MPNHVQNKLRVEGQHEAVMNYIRNGDIRIDFNTIIPMPECLKDYSPHFGIVTAVEKAKNVAFSSHPALAHLQAQSRKKQKTKFEGEEKKLFERGCKNFEETGFIYWYDWAIANWGTKWGAYGTPDKRDTEKTIYFETAWSNVVPVIEKLSSFFLSSKFYYKWADEDTGCNTGIALIENGDALVKCYDNQSEKAYQLAFELHPGLRQQMKRVDDHYEYIEY